MACRTANQKRNQTQIRKLRPISKYSRSLTLLDELDALVALHVLAIKLPDKSVNVRAARATNCATLPDAHAAQRDRVHLTAALLVPAGNDDSGHQRVPVVVAIVLELGRRLLDTRLLAGLVSICRNQRCIQ